MRVSARGSTALLVLAAATALTLLLEWPVVCHPTERIFGAEVVGRHHDPFTVMRQFGGATVSPPYLQPATDWPGRALARVVPPVAAYNLVILLTFPFSALTAYLFARQVTANPGASAIAGLAFSFAPFHIAHSAYHPHIAQVQWIPLFLFLLWQSVHRVTPWRALALAAAAAVAVLSNTYNVLLFAAIAPTAALVFWRMPAPDGERPTLRSLALSLGALATVAGLGLLWVHRSVPAAFSQQVAAHQSELVEYGARWWSYLVPPVNHRWLGGAARELWTASGVREGLLEQQVAVGWSVIALALVGVIASDGVPGDRQRTRGLAAIALLAAACSLSPGDGAWRWTMVWPSAWLHLVFPMFRAYARFAVVVQLMAVVLAAVGVTALWRRRGTRFVAAALLALLVFEYAPLADRARDVLPTSGHRWLARQADPRAVLDCTGPSLADLHTAWLAGFPIGYLGAAVPDCREPALAAKLAALGYTHLIVRSDAERRWLGAARPKEFAGVYRGLDAAVFRVDAVPGAYLEDFRGFAEREYDDKDTWRWTDGHAAIGLVAPATAPARRLTIAVTLEAFASPRRVIVSLDQVEVAVLAVAVGRATYSIGPCLVAPGAHELTLTSDEPAVSPKSVGVSADPRRLAFRLFQWTVE
jgi:hypothetical protein